MVVNSKRRREKKRSLPFGVALSAVAAPDCLHPPDDGSVYVFYSEYDFGWILEATESQKALSTASVYDLQ